ncbi:MAG: phosphoribosylformylglycinamidine synthase subunit PurS [Gemmatimonadetes bacterium]|nr:phosphoribosylformylglycinamidine synthase subunit PurS [Gemmatimonadota bacterium]
MRVSPRPGLLNPEGKAIHHALNALGFDAVSDVRVGKSIEVRLSAASEDDARSAAEAMARRLLANPVTEDYEVERIAALEPA